MQVRGVHVQDAECNQVAIVPMGQHEIRRAELEPHSFDPMLERGHG
jgi:hypothetical protein